MVFDRFFIVNEGLTAVFRAFIDRLDDMGYEYVDLKNYDDVYSDDLSDLGTHFIKFCIHDSKAHTCSAEIQATQNKMKKILRQDFYIYFF